MKQLFKTVLSFVGYHLKIWPVVFRLYRYRHGQPLLLALLFHRILPSEKGRRYFVGYDQGLDSSLFEFRVNIISQYLDLIDFDEFADVVTGHKTLTRHAGLLTFDDADCEFIDHVYPILARHNWPGVIYAPTGLVGTGSRLWHVRVSNVAARLTHDLWRQLQSQTAGLPDDVAAIIARYERIDDATRGEFAWEMIRALNRKNYRECEDILATFEKTVGSEDVLGIKCLDWEQLRFLQERGIAIESHAVTHRKLDQLDDDLLRRELADSKSQIEQELGKQVRSICYPGGAYNERVIRLAAEAGYTIGFLADHGICRYPIEGDDLLRLRRADVGSNDKYGMHFKIGMIALRNLFASKSPQARMN